MVTLEQLDSTIDYLDKEIQTKSQLLENYRSIRALQSGTTVREVAAKSSGTALLRQTAPTSNPQSTGKKRGRPKKNPDVVSTQNATANTTTLEDVVRTVVNRPTNVQGLTSPEIVTVINTEGLYESKSLASQVPGILSALVKSGELNRINVEGKEHSVYVLATPAETVTAVGETT